MSTLSKSKQINISQSQQAMNQVLAQIQETEQSMLAQKKGRELREARRLHSGDRVDAEEHAEQQGVHQQLLEAQNRRL